VWAAAQQYALQAVILLRLEDAGLNRSAPLVAAAVFSLVHAPNPGLVILTFLGGLLWCSVFRKYPSIPAVALSHAILAVAVVSMLPPETTGGFRIGPAYLQR
jgi:membrane protease YdiL (CAAX protease family)